LHDFPKEKPPEKCGSSSFPRLRVYVETIFMACQKPILMLLMKANFIALLFDFTARPPQPPKIDRGRKSALNSKC